MNTPRVDRADVERHGAAGLDQPAPLLQPVLLRSRRRDARRTAGHGATSAASRRRRSASRRFDRRTPARRSRAFGSDAQQPAEPRARRRARRSCSTRAIRRHRVRRIGRRRRAQRRHVHEHHRPVPASCSDNAPQCPTHARRGADAPLFPEQGTADDAVLQHRAGSARSPLGRMMGGLQDNSTIWLDGTGDGRRSGRRCFRSATARRRPASIRRAAMCSSRASRATASSRTSATATRRAGCAPTIRSATSNERDTITRVHRTAVHHVRRRQSRHAVHRVPARLAHAEQRRAAGVPRGELPVSGRRRERGRAATGCRSACAFPFAAGSTPASASRKPGDLTSDFYGASRAGGLIVAAERTPADAGTLWAATSFGRLFVSKNADARRRRRAVRPRSTRPTMPNRFVTRIVVGSRRIRTSRIVSYSGFNALTPATPGHIFRAVVRSASRNARRSRRSTSISAIIPDQHDRLRRRARRSLRRRRTSVRSCCARARRVERWLASDFRRR